MEGSEGPQDYSGELQDYSGNYLDNSDNYTDYLDGVILERSDSLLEDRAINTCGCAPVSSSNRIVGGKEVNPKGKLPYQVYFRGCMPDGRCGMCGGTIVNKKFVITAAHCYDSRMTSFTVIVGEHNLCDGLTNEGGKAIKVKKMTLHPDYNKDTISNDIAGVVSYGSGCASSTPGIYARVQGYLPWIKNLISSGECSGSSSGSSGGATTGKPSTAKPTTAKPTTTASSNGYGNDYYSYYG